MKIWNSKKALRDHLAELTTDLIAFPSHCEEPLKIFEMMTFVKDYFDGCKLYINEHTINGLPALVITTEATKHPHILLSGHLDVVCSSTQFTATKKGNKLYGSGTMDMKGGAACAMAIMKHFSQQKDRPSIGLMLTTDEEQGGEQTHHLLEHEGYCTNFCIVNEGRPRYEIVTKEKGFVSVNLKMTGDALHSAYPWLGKSILGSLMDACLEIKKEFPKPKDGWLPTATIVAFNGGHEKEINTIPGLAEASMSFRLTGGKKWDREGVLKLVNEKANGAEVEETVYAEVFEMDRKNTYIKALAQATKEIRQKRMSFATNNGASDARFFASKNIPTGVLGPVGRDHHTDHEHVEIDSLVTHFEVLRRFIENDSK